MSVKEIPRIKTTNGNVLNLFDVKTGRAVTDEINTAYGNRGALGPSGPPGDGALINANYMDEMTRGVGGRIMKRLVRVFIVDPDVQVPVENSVLHDSGEMLTDLTDQELFFEIDLKKKLKKHNAMRAGIVNNNVTHEKEMLKEIKVRDLVMTVSVIATF